jgi:hypothetical protein
MPANKGKKNKKVQILRSTDKDDYDGVSEAETNLSNHSSKTLNPIKYIFYCITRGKVDPILSSHYTNITSNSGQHYPLHRKLRLSAHINKKQADERLARSLHGKFGLRPALVFDNWSGQHQKYHEPIRGKGFKKMLEKKGFEVCLIDEFKTSSFCCNKAVKMFKTTQIPDHFEERKNLLSPSMGSLHVLIETAWHLATTVGCGIRICL